MLSTSLSRSVLGKNVPAFLIIALGIWPRAVPKTSSAVFLNTNRPRLVDNIFIFFSNLKLHDIYITHSHIAHS